LGCSVPHSQTEREGAGIPGGCSSPAKGWANGGVARPVVAASGGNPRDERVRDREGEGRGREGPRAVNERSSSGPAMVLCIGGPMTHIYEP